VEFRKVRRLVNDLPDRVISSLKIFAEKTKLWRTISDKSDSTTLQNDFNQLTEWCRRWQLQFNPSKCKLMHIGHKSRTIYYMNDDTGYRIMIEEVKGEKDLGIYIWNILKSIPSV